MNELVALTKIKGKGAGLQRGYLTTSAYLRAKDKGLLKDWVLTSEIEEIEIIKVNEDKKDLLIDDVEPLDFEESFETQESLEDKTTAELKEIMTSKKISIPSGQVKKQVLIDLIINNQ